MAAKQNTRSKKQHWIQPTYQWRKDILVTSGCSPKEILVIAKKYKAQPHVIRFIEDSQKRWEEMINGAGVNAFAAMEEERGIFVIRMPDYEDTWDFWETLIHELHHVVEFMAGRLKFENEVESKAYLHEFLFRNMRKKFMGVIPINSVS